MQLKITLLLCLMLSGLGCRSANFSRAIKLGEKEPAETPETTPTPPENPGENETPIADGSSDDNTTIPKENEKTEEKEGDETPLTIDPIEDQHVNSGKSSNRYSEKLLVPFKIKGGSGKVSIRYEMAPQSPLPTLDADKFVWKPGYISNGKLTNEVGTYEVKIIAEDTKKRSVHSSFKVTVHPITWQSSVKKTDSKVNMDVVFKINEELHPDRRYSHGPLGPEGTKLNAKRCISFVPGEPAIELDDIPTVTAGTAPTKSGPGFEHTENLNFKYSIDEQPYDNTVFVTWLNFKASDVTSNAGNLASDNGILIYYAFARCRNGPEDQNACKKASVLSNSMKNYYYCSEYFATSDHTKELKAMYCSFAKLNGLTPSGC